MKVDLKTKKFKHRGGSTLKVNEIEEISAGQ